MGDQIVKIAWLTGSKNFVDKRKKFIFNTYIFTLSQWTDSLLTVFGRYSKVYKRGSSKI